MFLIIDIKILQCFLGKNELGLLLFWSQLYPSIRPSVELYISCAIPGTCITPDFVGPLASAISKRLESIGHGVSVVVVVVAGVGVLTSQKANWPREHCEWSWVDLNWWRKRSLRPPTPMSECLRPCTAPLPLHWATPLTLAHIRMQKAKK